MPFKKVVAITGCDSGLGWALAARMAREGLTTVAGMLDTETEAAEALRKYCVKPYPLDVTKDESVMGFRDYVQEVVEENPDHKLFAIINNAGVMTIGDYEWQTRDMIYNTIDVNLLGAMRVTSVFLPHLRIDAKNWFHPPRIISVASHCGLQPLPGASVYSASKAGLLAWTHALRLELANHGVKALTFIPGGFIGSSKLLSNQSTKGHVMLHHLNDEQKTYYQTRITALNNYLSKAASNTRYDAVKDEAIIETFMQALTDNNPKELFKVESFRYKFYYNLFKLPFPEFIYRWMVNKFLNFPEA